jgi:hypothetical protein
MLLQSSEIRSLLITHVVLVGKKVSMKLLNNVLATVMCEDTSAGIADHIKTSGRGKSHEIRMFSFHVFKCGGGDHNRCGSHGVTS